MSDREHLESAKRLREVCAAQSADPTVIDRMEALLSALAAVTHPNFNRGSINAVNHVAFAAAQLCIDVERARTGKHLRMAFEEVNPSTAGDNAR